MVAEAINPSLTDSPDDFLAFLLRTGCKHQAVERAPIRALGGRAKNGNTSIIQHSSEPSPAFTAPGALRLLRTSLGYFPSPRPPVPAPGAHRQRSHHTEGKDPGAPRAASHAGDGGVGMAAQELCRGQEGAAVWGCGQSLSAPFLVYTVPRTPPAGLLMPTDSRSLDVTHSPWKKPSPAQGLLPPSHQIKHPAGGMRGKKP